MSIYGGRQAVIGCKFGEWILKSEPSKDDTISLNLFFDEDGHTNTEEPLNSEITGSEIWTGKGEFILPDFGKLVIFLNSMISDKKIKKLGQNVKK